MTGKLSQAFFAPVWAYLVDDAITEIMVNGPEEIFICREGEFQKVNSTFTAEQLEAAVLHIASHVGQKVNNQVPYFEATLPDRSRISVMMPPWSSKGISVAIRKSMLDMLRPKRAFISGGVDQRDACFSSGMCCSEKEYYS